VSAKLRAPADIRVRIGPLPARAAKPTVDNPFHSHLRYQERFGNLGFAADISITGQIEVLAAPILRHSPTCALHESGRADPALDLRGTRIRAHARCLHRSGRPSVHDHGAHRHGQDDDDVEAA